MPDCWPDFQMCPLCRLHGHIVLQHRNGPESGCLQHAEKSVHTGLQRRMFGPADAERLLLQINAAGLPDTFEALDIELQWKLEVWNRRMNESSTVVVDDFAGLHQYLTGVGLTPAPSNFVTAIKQLFAGKGKD